MVATTFAADTPNLVTNIVRETGVSGNWAWWAFLLSGMLTVFIYAPLWRRSDLMTDIEFYEIRYSGKAAAFLRGFRALYLGLFFNVMIMAVVCLAAIKMAGILLNLSPEQTILIAGSITVIYSMFGGLRGVILTDVIQFTLAIAGAILAAYYAIRHPLIGSLDGLFTHPNVSTKIALIPDFSNLELAVSIFVIPLLVQWWSVWYPGSEPGGGGYIAQRMFAAKNESGALKAVFLFNIAHYALRPWPWIIVALASLVVFPNLDALSTAFPGQKGLVDNDLAYPAMLSLLPSGVLGLVTASLIAAFMSTLSTHLNWGASYITNDFYKRFIRIDASENELLWVGRLSTLLLMVLAMLVALRLESALDGFQILLQIGAGTGLLFLLRWFWFKINAAAEITAMVASFLVAVLFNWGLPLTDIKLSAGIQLMIGIGITTICWVATAYLTPATDAQVIRCFKEQTRIKQINVKKAMWRALLGTVMIYATLFGTGYYLYSDYAAAIIALLTAFASGYLLYHISQNNQILSEKN